MINTRILPIVFVGLLVVLTACAVVDTKSISHSDTTGCRSTAGDYSLPKSMVKIQVSEKRLQNPRSKGDPTTTKLDVLEVAVVKDRDHTYCLDFLTAFTSQDTISVAKETSGLLKEIDVNVIDKTPEAIETLTTGLLGIVTRAGTTGDVLPNEIVFADNFDPFDEDSLTVLNHELRQFGFCVFVQANGQVIPNAAGSVDRYCDRKHGDRALTKAIHRTKPSYFHPVAREYQSSLLYRPAVTVDLILLYKPNRLARGGWQVYDKRILSVVDNRTILALDIRRALFASRRSTMTFTEGVLTNLVVNKTSELVGIAQATLQVARAIVQLPTEIVQFRINQADSRAQLIEAQAKVLQQRRLLLQERDTLRKTREELGLTGLDITRAGNNISFNQCVADCQQAFNADAATCVKGCGGTLN